MYNSIILNKPRKSISHTFTKSIQQNQSLDTYLRKKSQEYFFKLANQQITYQEMKIQFSKDILTMVLTTISASNVTKKTISQMEQHLQQNMTFLKTLYPQPKISVISRNVFEGLKQADFSDKVQFDLLANLNFKYSITNKDAPRMDILTQTQILFNNLIKSSEKTLSQFTHLLMTEIPKHLNTDSKIKYQNLMKQPWRFDLDNDITKSQHYNKDLVSERLFFTSIQLFKVIQQWIEHLQQILVDPQKYFTENNNLKLVNETHQNKINKIRNQARIFNHFPNANIDSGYSSAEPQQPNQQKFKANNQQKKIASSQQPFYIKIYHKVRNMCSGQNDIQPQNFLKIDDKLKIFQPIDQSTYQQTITEPTIQNVQNFTNYQFKQSGYLYNHFIESIQDLNTQVKYKTFCQEQLQFLRKGYIQTIRVVDRNKLKQKYTIEEKKVYSFSQNCYFFMEEIILDKLVKLVQTFLKLREKSQNHFQKCKVFQSVDLIKFNQKNVISAFIVADEKLLLDIYNSIIQLTKTRETKIAKIQNRFGTASNDAVILLKIKNNPILCKLRLILQHQKSGPQLKHKALYQMHEYLSEIQNFTYGPISYLSLILATKDHRVAYLQSIRRQVLEGQIKLSQVCHCGKGNVSEKSSINTFQKKVKGIITSEGNIKLDCYRNLIPNSFVCGVCQKVVKKGQCVIPVPSCAECGFHICVQCQFQNNPEAQKSVYTMLFNSVVKIVDPCYFSQLQLSDLNKKNYNHSYTKDVQILANKKAQIRKQIHYHIILEGKNFVRFGKLCTVSKFWEQVKQKIDLRSIPDYKESIKKNQFVGILFRPRQLLREKGQPFIFIQYNTETLKFSKYTHKMNQQNAKNSVINVQDINVSQNDAFMPILWIFGESLVTDFITKVLQTNPFCVKKVVKKDLSRDHMRFSRSRINYSHHIMR